MEEYTGPERRSNWEKCGHHEQLEKEQERQTERIGALKREMRDGFSRLTEEIAHIKGDNRAYEERFISLFNKLAELTAWIKGLVMLLIGSLISFFIWFIQTMGQVR